MKNSGAGCEPGISVLDGPMVLSNRKSLAASHRNCWSVFTARTLRPFLHVARAFPKIWWRIAGSNCESKPVIILASQPKGSITTEYLVEDSGFEPLTSCMPCTRSPS